MGPMADSSLGMAIAANIIVDVAVLDERVEGCIELAKFLQRRGVPWVTIDAALQTVVEEGTGKGVRDGLP